MTGFLAPLDHVWQSPGFATWLALVAAVLFGLIVLVTMLRVERTVANAALAVITLAALSIAVSVSMRGNGESASVRAPSSSAAAPVSTAMIAAPALACVDDLAGDIVLAACERVLFGSADSAAAAVSYAASKISQLTAHGNVAAANGAGTGEVAALRRLVERDRYGLMAYVLMARDQCQPESCPAFTSLSDRSKLVANMEERTYAGMIARYAPSWNAPAALVPAVVSSLPPSVPTGKPTNAEFPTSNSIPPINIMTPEPPLAGVRAPAAPTAAKKPAAQPKARPPAQAQPPQAAPVQLAPQAGRVDN